MNFIQQTVIIISHTLKVTKTQYYFLSRVAPTFMRLFLFLINDIIVLIIINVLTSDIKIFRKSLVN